MRARYPSDIAGVLVLRVVGCRVRGTNVSYQVGLVLVWLTVAAGLLAWHAVVVLVSTNPFDLLIRSFIWSVYFLGAGLLVIVVAHRLTQGFLDLTVSLHTMLTRRGLAAYDAWYRRFGRTWPQLLSGLAVGGGAVPALLVVRQVLGSNGAIVVVAPSLAVVAVVGFLVGAAAYWGAAGSVLIWTWGRRGNLRLYRFAPAHTPGLEALSHLIINSFTTAVAISAVFLFPTLYSTAGVTVGSLRPEIASALALTRTGLVAACAIVLIALAVMPHVALSRSIREARHATMVKLLRAITRQENHTRQRLDPALASVFRDVAESPSSTLGSGNIVQLAAAGIGAFIPLIVSVLVK